MRKPTKTPTVKTEPRALKVYQPKRQADGKVETSSRILCPTHREGIFSFSPSAYGAGEFFPLSECVVCKGVTS